MRSLSVIWKKRMTGFRLDYFKMTFPPPLFSLPLLAVFVPSCSSSGCLCPRFGCVPLLTRWDECFQRQTRQKSPDFYYLAKLLCDGKILLKEWYLNNWSPRALNLQGTRCDFQRKVRGHLNKIFISLFKNEYIRELLRYRHTLAPAPFLSPCVRSLFSHPSPGVKSSPSFSVSSLWNGLKLIHVMTPARANVFWEPRTSCSFHNDFLNTYNILPLSHSYLYSIYLQWHRIKRRRKINW